MSTGLGDAVGIERGIQITRKEVRRIDQADASPAIEPRRRSYGAMRAVNLMVATFALVVTSPVLVLCAILVKLASPGPIFYTQTRVGIDRRRTTVGRAGYDRRARNVGGLPFIIYKF